MDFIAQRLPDGRWIRVLTVVNQFTRECLALFADNSTGAYDRTARPHAIGAYLIGLIQVGLR